MIGFYNKKTSQPLRGRKKYDTVIISQKADSRISFQVVPPLFPKQMKQVKREYVHPRRRGISVLLRGKGVSVCSAVLCQQLSAV